MHRTHARFILKYSPFSSTFSLAVVINLEITMTNTSFLNFIVKIFTDVIIFLFTEKVFNIRKVLFFLFSNNTNIYYGRLLASTLFLSIMMPRTSLVVLVLFISLVDRRLLLPIK